MSGKMSPIRKQEIKKALFDIITTEGIQKLSTKNLAQHAGLSEGAIYRHFKSKDAIFQSIANDVEHDMIENLRKIALSSMSPKTRLKSFICTHYQYLHTHRGINILLFSLASYNDNVQLLSILSRIFNLEKKYFSKIVTDGILEGIWDNTINPDKLSEFYMGIPTTFNIEIHLDKEKLFNKNVCLKIYALIIKILEK